jgi:hypothetical protein
MAIVLDPHTYRFRSYAVTEQHPGQPIRLTEPVILHQQLVSGPGVVPVSERRTGGR